MIAKFRVSHSFKKHLSAEESKITISEGGARSSKNYSIMQLIIGRLLSGPGKKATVVSETNNHLRDGAISDFINIMKSADVWNEARWNISYKEYKFSNGSLLQFVSIDRESKGLGARRDILYINEADIIPYSIASQLMIRTRDKIYLDFNPRGENWIHREIMDNPSFKGLWKRVHSTFLDNQFFSDEERQFLLARAERDANFHKVYVLGERGTVEGIIFPKFTLVDQIPEEILRRAPQRIGLDWGFTSDPAAAAYVYILSKDRISVDQVWIDEIFYKTGMLNRDIGNALLEIPRRGGCRIIADSAEPKSIQELVSMRLNVHGAFKPPGSVNFSIDLLLGAEIYITKRSLNTITEFRNWRWATDRDGKTLKDSKGRPVPIDNFNHLIDGIRYCSLDAWMEHKENFRTRGPRSSSGLIPA